MRATWWLAVAVSVVPIFTAMVLLVVVIVKAA